MYCKIYLIVFDTLSTKYPGEFVCKNAIPEWQFEAKVCLKRVVLIFAVKVKYRQKSLYSRMVKIYTQFGLDNCL